MTAASRKTAYKKRYLLDRARGVDRSMLDAGPYQAKVADLVAQGLSIAAIARAARIDRTGLRRMVHEETTTIRRAGAARIRALTYRAVIDACGDRDLVPLLGVQRRVQALMVMGWRIQDIEDRSGVRALHGRLYDRQRIAAVDYRRIAALYDELWDAKGPSRKGARKAASIGYAPPLAWDDDTIDDPKAVPVEWRDITARGHVRVAPIGGAFVENIEFMADSGETFTGAARRLGITEPSLQDMLKERGRSDLAARLRRERAAS